MDKVILTTISAWPAIKLASSDSCYNLATTKSKCILISLQAFCNDVMGDEQVQTNNRNLKANLWTTWAHYISANCLCLERKGLHPCLTKSILFSLWNHRNERYISNTIINCIYGFFPSFCIVIKLECSVWGISTMF